MKWYVPPKRRFLQEPHGVTSHWVALFILLQSSLVFGPRSSYGTEKREDESMGRDTVKSGKHLQMFVSTLLSSSFDRERRSPPPSRSLSGSVQLINYNILVTGHHLIYSLLFKMGRYGNRIVSILRWNLQSWAPSIEADVLTHLKYLMKKLQLRQFPVPISTCPTLLLTVSVV
jgi:hypothetical protein